LSGRNINDVALVYDIVSDKISDGLNARVMYKNGENRFLAFKPYQPIYLDRNVSQKMKTSGFDITKDFVLDISTDYFQTASRYNVHRYQQGGHWSVVTTLTRHDGKVGTSIQGLNRDVDQLLVNNQTGQSFYCNVEYGNVFDLGFLPDGDYQFSLKTYNGITINDRISIRVKRPAVN
jgi:hypothetical protein